MVVHLAAVHLAVVVVLVAVAVAVAVRVEVGNDILFFSEKQLQYFLLRLVQLSLIVLASLYFAVGY